MIPLFINSTDTLLNTWEKNEEDAIPVLKKDQGHKGGIHIFFYKK